MKMVLVIIGILLGIMTLCVVSRIALTPWMNRKGATTQKRAATFPGDTLLSAPARTSNLAIIIQAAPQQIFPCILQTGADKAGMYSYTWLGKA